jgi:hypothetical protein
VAGIKLRFGPLRASISGVARVPITADASISAEAILAMGVLPLLDRVRFMNDGQRIEFGP